MAATTRDSKIEKTDHRVLLTNIFFGVIIYNWTESILVRFPFNRGAEFVQI